MWEYEGILIPLISGEAEFTLLHGQRVHFRTSEQSSKHIISVVFILALLLQLFMPCSALTYQFPIKQARRYVTIGDVNTSSSEDKNKTHVFRRDVYSSDDLSGMKNNLNGLSGDGYYIDIDIGTPPQKV